VLACGRCRTPSFFAPPNCQGPFLPRCCFFVPRSHTWLWRGKVIARCRLVVYLRCRRRLMFPDCAVIRLPVRLHKRPQACPTLRKALKKFCIQLDHGRHEVESVWSLWFFGRVWRSAFPCSDHRWPHCFSGGLGPCCRTRSYLLNSGDRAPALSQVLALLFHLHSV